MATVSIVTSQVMGYDCKKIKIVECVLPMQKAINSCYMSLKGFWTTLFCCIFNLQTPVEEMVFKIGTTPYS